jgi:glycosyltransferase involved in cell wall biosynthesis
MRRRAGGQNAMSTPGILLDFSAIRTGGGVQLALNFLDAVFRAEWSGIRLFVLLPDSGALRNYPLPLPAERQLRCPSAPLRRAWFEHRVVRNFIRANGIRVIKTLFGAGLPHGGAVTSVVGVAYPIICYPESPYWRHLRWADKLRQQLKNTLRRRRLRQADYIVVETSVMRRRLVRHCGLRDERMLVLPPAPTAYLDRTVRRREGGEPTTFLFLSGVSPHKNLWRLPAVAYELMKQGATDRFRFLVSCGSSALDDAFTDAPYTRSHFEFLGPVDSRDIQQVYERADVLVNLSDLESFSNNYMEAWKARLPIIASDRDFAREICRGSAVYCEPHDAADVASRMLAFIRGDIDVDAMVAHGAERLLGLHTQEARLAHVREMLISLARGREAVC